MGKSLAELRAEREGVNRPQRVEDEATVYLKGGQSLVREVEELHRRRTELEMELLRLRGRSRGGQALDDDGGEQPAGPPLKLSEGGDHAAARDALDELDQEILAVSEKMAAYEGQLLLASTRTDGQWRLWCDEHPPRKEGEPGHDRDLEVAGVVTQEGRELLYCNADDLIEDLGSYVVAWDGEPLSEGDWDDTVAVSYADKKLLARRVVFRLYEQGVDVPDFRRRLSVTPASGRSSRQPTGSGSPRSGSSDGSRPSGTSTTTPTAT